MIKFTCTRDLLVPDDSYTWSDLMRVIVSEDSEYDTHMAPICDIAKLKAISTRLGGVSCIDMSNDTCAQVILIFDDPHKEMLFKLKYL